MTGPMKSIFYPVPEKAGHGVPGVFRTDVTIPIAPRAEQARVLARVSRAQLALEVSTYSDEPLGRALSAFSLTVDLGAHGRTATVEALYQGSKAFARGGPYTDLYNAPSLAAKRDRRLRSSGPLVGFRFFGRDFPLEPKSYFYDWLWINTVAHRPHLLKAVQDLAQRDTAFTDTAFDPYRGVACQAGSAALMVAMIRTGTLDEALRDKESFLRVVSG